MITGVGKRIKERSQAKVVLAGPVGRSLADWVNTGIFRSPTDRTIGVGTAMHNSCLLAGLATRWTCWYVWRA